MKEFNALVFRTKSPRTLLGIEEKFSSPLDLQNKAILNFENSVDTPQVNKS
jgi:hypothetical protein